MSNRNYSSFAAGALLYYILSFVFAWFPAIVFGVQISELTWGYMDKGASYICGLVGIFIGWFLVRCLIVKASQNSDLWLYVGLTYLFCLWPFIQLVMFFMGNGEYEQSTYKAEFPGFDWIPFI